MVEPTDELVLRDAQLRDHPDPVHILVRGGRFARIGPEADTAAARSLDLAGRLVIPPLVDAHMHLDSALTLDPRHPNRSGTLWEGIDVWAARKATLTGREVHANAREVLRWMVAHGTLHVRCHVDVSTPGLDALRALLDLREEVRGVCDVQLVAFPQDGLYGDGLAQGADRVARVREAMALGCDVVGGIPHYERTPELGQAHVRTLFEVAEDFDADIDMHCDETDDPDSRYAELVARETVARGRQGRVVVSHCTAMAGYEPAVLARTAALLADAGVGVVANPFVNVVLQGRGDAPPVRRGMAPIGPLLDAGVTVGLGQDSVMDPWLPLGTGDLLAVAQLGALLGHRTGHDQLREMVSLVTDSGARLLRLGEGYGIREGAPADFVVLDAADPIEALRLLPARLHVFRGGREVARSQPSRSELTGDFAAGPVDFGRQPTAVREAATEA
ncbi:amidohydrolase family protein [Streptomyces hygroscopicus]|uniref:amidohydrolase family protein n=1 Tax=Streptomyces hygroscopicus TaxID=1912 RepID=UPI0033CB8E01